MTNDKLLYYFSNILLTFNTKNIKKNEALKYQKQMSNFQQHVYVRAVYLKRHNPSSKVSHISS